MKNKCLCNFTFNKSKCWLTVLVVATILLIWNYFCIYLNLNTNLESNYDEGFFYLILKPLEMLTVETKPLSLGTDIIHVLFPFTNNMDVLSLRQLAFFTKLVGIVTLLLTSVIYINNSTKQKSNLENFLIVTIGILIVGKYVLPSMVINGNDLLLLFTSLILSFTLLFLLSKKWVYKVLLLLLVGFISVLAILTNAPGGGMVFLITSVFMICCDNFSWKKCLYVYISLFLGVCFGVLYVHLNIISINDIIDFVHVAIQQTTAGGAASHHSMDRVILVILFGIRDLLITVTTLFGLTFIHHVLSKTMLKKWVIYLILSILFVVLVKWMIKPQIYFASLITWFVLMFTISAYNNNRVHRKDVFLILFLFLLPLGASFGTNSNLLFKSTQNILPWGMLLSILYVKGKELNPKLVRILFVGFLAYVLITTHSLRTVQDTMTRQPENCYKFTQESPIARMNLNVHQAMFYDEVYETLISKGYTARKDTLLGFCFNEMTIVAMNAIPYTNNQLPEEFLRHDLSTKPSPSYMILSEWDSVVLYNHFQQLDWNFPNGYKKYKLSTNADPNSGYAMTNSTIYIKQKEIK